MTIGYWVLHPKLRLSRNHGRNQSPPTPVISELAEVDALPGTKVQPSPCDWDADRTACQHRLHVSGHVVRAFQCVGHKGHVLRHEAVEEPLEVHPDRRVGVLVDGQASARVLYKKVKQPILWQRPYLAFNLGCDEMETTWVGWQ